MTVLHADLTIQDTPVSSSASGLLPRGSIRASYHTLTSQLGEPGLGLAGQPTDDCTLWTVDTPAGRLQLFDWAPAAKYQHHPDREITWTIQGVSDAVLPWLFKIVTGSTAGFPTAPAELFGESTLASQVAAYRDYLYLRMEATLTWLQDLDRTTSDFRASSTFRDNRYLPRQLNHAALAVADMLNHYHWSQSSPAERANWAAMSRPVQHPGQSQLQFWIARNRWLYPPVLSDAQQFGGNPDLPGMLAAAARHRKDDRDDLLTHNQGLNQDFYDEDIATLQTLAAAQVPGSDFLSGGRR